MALEAIISIKNVENEAEQKVKKAQAESKDIIKNAKIKAKVEYEKMLNEGNLESKKIIDEAVQSGKEESTPILEKGELEVKNITNIPQQKFDEAVNLVVERIVKFNGNS